MDWRMIELSMRVVISLAMVVNVNWVNLLKKSVLNGMRSLQGTMQVIAMSMFVAPLGRDKECSILSLWSMTFTSMFLKVLASSY